MVALALALAYVATLAFAAFLLVMRTRKPAEHKCGAAMLPELVASFNAQIRELSDKVAALQLAQGLRVEKRRDG